MKKLPNIFLSILSGLLLGAAWYKPFTFLIFIAWVPLLLIEQNLSETIGEKRNKLKLTGLVYLSFFIWNLTATWWIVYASVGGACMAIFSNAFLFTMVFMIFHNAKHRINKPWSIWLLIPIWIAWEYGHGLWDLAWTWLTLGNVFAFEHNWIQWYEFTGTSGGSLWILIVNILIFSKFKVQDSRFKVIAVPLGIIVLPIIISLLIKPTAQTYLRAPGSQISTVVVQPNLDPYNEKFEIDPQVQLQSLLKQINGKINGGTDYLVLPETFLTEDIFESEMENTFSIKFLRDSILSKYPELTIVTGASTMKVYADGEKLSGSARKFSNSDKYYDSYNTGLQIENLVPVQIYHKSLLVPGVERMPFPALFKPLEKLAIDMGGTTGSLGTQETRTVFFNKNKIGIAPVICYESIFSDYVADYIRNGAQIIFIITNDGWWDDTPGYKNHLDYGRLRAIETRCQIARSANTGISCFIDEAGEIDQATKWWEEAVITKDIYANNAKTFFVRMGDLITKTSVPIALGIFLFSQYLRFARRKS